MDLIKQYIAQSLTAASNNLRLTNHQLESLGLLREVLLKSDDLAADIDKMKTITELSTLAIRLNEIYNYLSHGKIDFLKFSDQFKKHSQYLINDLTQLLGIDNPALIKDAINKLNDVKGKKESAEIEVILSEDKTDPNTFAVNENGSHGNINGKANERFDVVLKSQGIIANGELIDTDVQPAKLIEQEVLLKGLFIGYDNLLEEIKLIECSIKQLSTD